MKREFADKLHEMLSYTGELSVCSTTFESTVKQLLGLKEFSLGVDWYIASSDDFIKDSLRNVKLTEVQKEELEKLFANASREAFGIKALMEETDKHIARMVHEQMEEEASQVDNSINPAISDLQKRRAAAFKEMKSERKRIDD